MSINEGHDNILKNLVAITRALKLTEGAKDELTLHYIAHRWLGANATPTEMDLARLAVTKIQHDPKQYDVFLDMLGDTEGMSLIVVKITGNITASPRLPRSGPPQDTAMESGDSFVDGAEVKKGQPQEPQMFPQHPHPPLQYQMSFPALDGDGNPYEPRARGFSQKLQQSPFAVQKGGPTEREHRIYRKGSAILRRTSSGEHLPEGFNPNARLSIHDVEPYYSVHPGYYHPGGIEIMPPHGHPTIRPRFYDDYGHMRAPVHRRRSGGKFDLVKKRGLGILVTCHYGNTLPQTKNDARKMKEMFTQFKYDIHELSSEEATFSGIKKLVREVASYLRLYDGAAVNRDGNKKVIIFAFSGHGADNQITTNDGKQFGLHEIVKSLVNPDYVAADPIPKLFFIDACRGKVKDDLTGSVKGNYCIEYATLKNQQAAAVGPGSAWMPVLAEAFKNRDETYQHVIAEVKQQVANVGFQRAQSVDNLIGGKFKLFYYEEK